MELVKADHFLASLRDRGISVAEHSFRLTFGRYEETDRFWVWPWPPPDLLGLLTAILEHIAPTAYCDAWRPGGIWHEEEPSFTDSVRNVLVDGFAIPAGHRGALRFDRSEAAALSALVLTFAIAGWNVNDDLCLVPDNGQFIVRVSHHAVLHVECRESNLISALVEHLASRGWDLPTDVPDATFKIPTWMVRPDHEAPT